MKDFLLSDTSLLSDTIDDALDFETLVPEIDQFVTAPRRANSGYDIKDFEAFLTGRKFEPEKVYSPHSREKVVTMCRFFDSENSEKILAEIEQKNREQNMGNITIPGTNIKLINYPFCPQCKTVFSHKDLLDYYQNPTPDDAFKNRAHQMREDTRICCYQCGTHFFPAMVISDGTPKNETQFLCRSQTVGAIERFFLEKNRKVLSRNPKNLTTTGEYITIRNDVALQDLASKPTLITNLLQYTPMNLMPNLIAGTNVEKGDILFKKMRLVV